MHLKKALVIIIVALLKCAISHAQTLEVGVSAGSSGDLSCLADLGADIAMIFPTSSGFDMGFGAGIRLASPMYLRNIKTVVNDSAVTGKIFRKYSADLTLPVSARFRYRFPSDFFLQADAGYRFGLLSLHYGIGWAPDNGKACKFRGIFIEPQAGFRLNDRKTISFGIVFQRYGRGDDIQSFTSNQTFFSHTNVSAWSPIVFVRYSLSL